MTTREPSAEALRHRLESYTPSGVDAAKWAAVRDLVISAVIQTEPTSPRVALDLAGPVGRLALWGLSEGVPVGLDTLFVPTTVERFVAVGMAGATDTTRATYRSHLRRVGKNVVPGRWTLQALTMAHRRVQPPYTEALVSRFLAAARVQRGTVTGARAGLYISLGAGAGLDSRDIRGLRPDHIDETAGAVVVSVVAEGRQREVPVLRSLVPHLEAALDTLDGKELVRGGNNAVNAVYRKLALHDLPPLVQARLRSTWLVAQMGARVPIADLLRAAGVKTARSLEDLIDYVPAVSGAEAVRLLSRGRRR